MRILRIVILPLVFLVCTSFIQPYYFVEVLLPIKENCWMLVHYDKGKDSVYLKECYSGKDRNKYEKVLPLSSMPSVKKIYGYNFKELDKLCEPLKLYDFTWENDAVILIKHYGCIEGAYKIKLSIKGNKKQEKLKQLIAEMK